MRISCLLFALYLILCSCGRAPQEDQYSNPAAPGFDSTHSDRSAIALADSVMKAMGGRKHWDDTRFISWNFFDVRNLVWDKTKARVRIESLTDSIIYLIDINNNEGRVQVRGNEITDNDSLQKMVDKGKGIWINDSYWLVMPFKLKDTGVTLKDLGMDTLATSEIGHKLQLTFQDVGSTPENKYHIYIDPQDYLVEQWAYFSSSAQDSANFIRPWDNYKRYGNILLSADRSDGGGPKRVTVSEILPDSTFTEF